jgi:N4-gp56 family major capsid protein
VSDAYTSTSLTDLVKTGYDRAAYFALRPELYFSLTSGTRRKPTMETNPGTTITWTGYDELAVATTPLTETTTPDSVAPTTAVKSVTITEYGNVAKSTSKLRGSTFLDVPGIDPALADLIGFNAALSYDTLARTALVAGTNVYYIGSGNDARNKIDAASTITSAAVRYVVAKIRGANGRPFGDMGVGNGYAGFIHPDVSVDLRQETDAGGWLVPVDYGQDQSRRWNGMIGRYEGVQWIETPRAPLFADASSGAGGAGLIDVYATLIVGREALSMAWSKLEHGPEPSFVVGPIVDALKRFHTLGWKWFGGFGRFRDTEELYRIESSSSIGANT